MQSHHYFLTLSTNQKIRGLLVSYDQVTFYGSRDFAVEIKLVIVHIPMQTEIIA